MDIAHLSTLSALAGSVVGSRKSGVATWLGYPQTSAWKT